MERDILISSCSDWICNWEGVLWASYALEWPGQNKFVAAPFSNYTVDGKAHGRYKTAENLSFLKVWEAGHSVAYYRKFHLRVSVSLLTTEQSLRLRCRCSSRLCRRSPLRRPNKASTRIMLCSRRSGRNNNRINNIVIRDMKFGISKFHAVCNLFLTINCIEYEHFALFS